MGLAYELWIGKSERIIRDGVIRGFCLELMGFTAYAFLKFRFTGWSNLKASKVWFYTLVAAALISIILLLIKRKEFVRRARSGLNDFDTKELLFPEFVIVALWGVFTYIGLCQTNLSPSYARLREYVTVFNVDLHGESFLYPMVSYIEANDSIHSNYVRYFYLLTLESIPGFNPMTVLRYVIPVVIITIVSLSIRKFSDFYFKKPLRGYIFRFIVTLMLGLSIILSKANNIDIFANGNDEIIMGSTFGFVLLLVSIIRAMRLYRQKNTRTSGESFEAIVGIFMSLVLMYISIGPTMHAVFLVFLATVMGIILYHIREGRTRGLILIKMLDIMILFLSLITFIGFGRIELDTLAFVRKEYRVTQYSGLVSQSMFYTIETPDNKLIIIDGGWTGDAPLVQEVINEHGGHVDAWFISHPHFDHVGAFNEIYAHMEENGITIDKIYASDFDYDRYASEAQEWDMFEDFETFEELTKGDDRLEFLYTGDTFDLYGLTVEVFHDYTAKIDGDAANDGSLMLKFSAKDLSWLFCGDVGRTQSDIIMSKFSEEDLHADYLTMGHHGNGGLTEAFYREVHPEVALFDAPEWLFFPGEDDWYNTPVNRAIIESMGATCIWWENPSYTFYLY